MKPRYKNHISTHENIFQKYKRQTRTTKQILNQKKYTTTILNVSEKKCEKLTVQKIESKKFEKVLKI